MGRRLTLRLGDREVKAEQVSFKVMKEEWSEYELENGMILRIRPVIAEVYILDDKDPVTGKPNVLVKSQNVISLILPPEGGEGESGTSSKE